MFSQTTVLTNMHNLQNIAQILHECHLNTIRKCPNSKQKTEGCEYSESFVQYGNEST